MNIRDLEYFLQVCEDKNIHKAAEKLFISPQGLSQTIKKIEKELGAEILKRTNYGVDLTDEGRVFAKHARQITEHMVFLNREIEQLANVETGQLFISISYGMFSFYKAKCILDFKALYPDITLEYREYTDKKAVESVWYGESDLALTYLPVDKERFRITPLNRNELFLVVNKKNPLSTKEHVSFGDLRDQRLILQNQEFVLHNFVKDQCKKHGFVPKIIFESNGVCMCNKLCRDNIGVTVSMKHVLEDIKAENLVLIPFEKRAYLDIVLISRLEMPETKEMKLYKDFILTYSQHF